MLLTVFSESDYLPEYGTLVVRDTRRSSPIAASKLAVRDELHEHFSSAVPSGSLGRSGEGWLQTTADDSWQSVGLELHDSAPAVVESAEDIIEVPYLCRSGAIALDSMTGVTTEPAIELDPGRYRVRISRWSESDGSRWLLQFWPDPWDESSPQWMRRASPAVNRGATNPYARLAADIVSLAAWNGDRSFLSAELADVLLVPVSDVTAAVHAAVNARLLAADGEIATAHVRLTVLPSAAWSEHRERSSARDARRTALSARLRDRALAAPMEADGAGTSNRSPLMAVVSHVMGGRAEAEMPLSERPLVGVVARDGGVFVRRDGALRLLANIGAQYWPWALESGNGVVVLGSQRSVLVRYDGTVVPLTDRLAHRAFVLSDGLTLAIEEDEVGRQARTWLHRIDLSDATRVTADCEVEQLVGVHNTAVFYRGPDRSITWRWIVGHAPQQLPYEVQQVDPLTGALVVRDGSGPHSLLVRADGTAVGSTGPDGAQLSAGAKFWYVLRKATTGEDSLHLFGVDGGERIVALPTLSATSPATPSHPTWEDAHTLVVPRESATGIRATRIDVRTGGCEAVSAPPQVGSHPTSIDPLLTA